MRIDEIIPAVIAGAMRAGASVAARQAAKQAVKKTAQGTVGTTQQQAKSAGQQMVAKTIGKAVSQNNQSADFQRGQEVEFDDPKNPNQKMKYKVKNVGGRDVTLQPTKKRPGEPQTVTFDKKSLAQG